MILDDLKTVRKVSLGLLLITIELVIIAAFGARWTSGLKGDWYVGKHDDIPGIAPPYSTIIPFPVGGDWWYCLTCIVMYMVLIMCFLYVVWTIIQIALPNRVPLDLKRLVFVDIAFSGLLALMLLFSYCFFAAGFGGKSGLPGMGFGYCFWLAITSSISSFSVAIISGLGFYRNN